jgi:hypothetical protein
MGWSIGIDPNWDRDIGYGVPAFCDHPGCGNKIDRGLSYVCGGEAYGGQKGCGLFFCEEHIGFYNKRLDGKIELVGLCYRCGHYKKAYNPKPDHPEWIAFKLTDKSWRQWREENPMEVKKMSAFIKGMKKNG